MGVTLTLMHWSGIYFADSWSPLMYYILKFHEHTMMFLIFIFSLISFIMFKLCFNSQLNLKFTENEKLEIGWTLGPCVILILLAVPSLQTLYYLDELYCPLLTLKIVGHQWYWSYEISDMNLEKRFDSYMKKNNPVFRLLEVDNRVVLPYFIHVRGLVTSEDVLHSWTLPSLGVKIDANPGRINMIHIFCDRTGIVYGQCSEICGVNHSLMPISVEFTNLITFKNWLLSENN